MGKIPIFTYYRYHSCFIEISKLSTGSSLQVITHIKSIFARHDISQTILSDNGPQYSSDLFANFSQQYGFIHIKSSPKYLQANGEAKRAVRTIKSLLKKNKYQDGDVYLALLAYRSTPIANCLNPNCLNSCSQNIRIFLKTRLVYHLNNFD